MVKRIYLLRDVDKDGSYSTRWGIARQYWYVRVFDKQVSVKYKAICISLGTYDIIICYRRIKEE